MYPYKREVEEDDRREEGNVTMEAEIGVEEEIKCLHNLLLFCLCNSACSLQSLDHTGLRKWGLTILGTGAYLTHPCPALCNRPNPCKPENPLNHACPCIKTL